MPPAGFDKRTKLDWVPVSFVSVFGIGRRRPFLSDSRAVVLYPFGKLWISGSILIGMWRPV